MKKYTSYIGLSRCEQKYILYNFNNVRAVCFVFFYPNWIYLSDSHDGELQWGGWEIVQD